MWFLGALVGLILGSLAKSGPLALLLAVLGGVLFHALWSTKKQDAAEAESPADADSGKAQARPSRSDLTRRVTDLEARVMTLEADLQALRLGEMPAVPATAPQPAHTSLAAQMHAPASRAQIPVEPPAPSAPSAGDAASAARQAEYEGPDTVPLAYQGDTAAADAGVQGGLPRAPERAPEPALEPALSWRERLPAPVANFLFGGNSLVRLGVVVLFLGLAFLLRYAAERVTVPIELRYAGVGLVGLGLLALGWVLRRKRADYAQILQGTGIAVIYLTTLAGMKWHGLVPPTAGFIFLALVAVLAAMLAVLQNAYPLALAAALGGFAAPVLASTGGGQPLPLFTYLALLDMGILLIAWFKAWRWLNVIGFVCTSALAGAWVQKYYAPEHDALLQVFLIFFLFLFTAVGLLFARRSLEATPPDEGASLGLRAAQSVATVGRVDSALAFGVPMVAFGLQYGLTRQWEYGPAYAALAFAFFYLLVARWVLALDRRGLSLLAEAYAVIGVIFITLSIPLGLEGLWTGAAWAVEGVGMYWLGVRQQRPYARALAFVVMAGAAWKLLQDITIVALPQGSLLQGSVLGPVLLAASAFVIWALHRKLPALNAKESSLVHDWEQFAAGLMPWLGWAALTLLPWQWWPPQAAAAATAGLSLLAFALGTLWSLAAFQAIVLTLQGLALLAFLLTLHRIPGAGAEQPLLENGASGLFYALAITACMLITSGWRMLAIRRRAMEQQIPPNWSVRSSIVLVTAVGLLHLSTLFVFSLADAAWLWPITGLVVLGVALRMAHTPLAWLAVALPLLSALVHLSSPRIRAAGGLDVFANVAFAQTLSLAVCGLLAAWWFSISARRMQAGERWVCSWTTSNLALWWTLAWGLIWWFLTWLFETTDFALAPWGPGANWVPVLHTLVYIATSALLAGMALTLGWRQAGTATAFTLPLVIWAMLEFVYRFGGTWVPSAHGGIWVWPLAFAWHFVLLRRQPDWLPASLIRGFHLAGFWFFLLLAARESQWRIGGDAATATSWAMLGWVLVPALVLVGLRSRLAARWWPLSEFGHLYRETACIPVALYLLAWLWVGNVLSAGSALPLPYLPFINPLELGQWLVLLALALWWRDASAHVRGSPDSKLAQGVLPLTALALLTGTVLRSVHHYAGVDWTVAAMMQSHVAQAALSVVWASCAVAVMVMSNRAHARTVWLAGAALMGVVILKLFLVDLADRGGLYRIVSFLAVGTLLLLVGYFAPVPPQPKAAASRAGSEDGVPGGP